MSSCYWSLLCVFRDVCACTKRAPARNSGPGHQQGRLVRANWLRRPHCSCLCLLCLTLLESNISLCCSSQKHVSRGVQYGLQPFNCSQPASALESTILCEHCLDD